ncbi:MAG: hypothetical protein KatS3mg014_0684 [Actinomycetota bacterium]|nr:MAG: hypothetical protein KatS3mg014_0684 [Actinomycetota bacterium]
MSASPTCTPATAPLYETDHRAREVWRQTEVLADLGGFYRAFGLAERGERGDHVSVELEFLHVLAYKTAWALERGEAEHAERCREAERAFLAEHVLRWLPDVAERLRVVGRGSPYEAVGVLLAAYLQTEAERTGPAARGRDPRWGRSSPAARRTSRCARSRHEGARSPPRRPSRGRGPRGSRWPSPGC